MQELAKIEDKARKESERIAKDEREQKERHERLQRTSARAIEEVLKSPRKICHSRTAARVIEDQAKKIVLAINAGKIPNISIKY